MEELFEKLLNEAVSKNVTDIHFNLSDGYLNVSFRVDGRIENTEGDYNNPKLLRYIRYLSNLDVASSLKPDTGSFEQLVGNSLLSIRFAYIRNGQTENGVLRILNAESKLKVDDLTPYVSDIEFFKSIIKRENGLIILSGATGSGKTTAMYTLLNSVKEKMIYTIEDPIEIVSKNFIQLQISEATGFDYNAAIKQVMRHDPDIIMIGEIRDETAAKAAVRAANTGHLVISSIHASNTNIAMCRLLDLGVDRNNLEDVLIAVLNQQLFSDGKGGKTCVFERMDEREIEFYFKNGYHSEDFVPIEEKIRYAATNKAIVPVNS